MRHRDNAYMEAERQSEEEKVATTRERSKSRDYSIAFVARLRHSLPLRNDRLLCVFIKKYTHPLLITRVCLCDASHCGGLIKNNLMEEEKFN